MVVEFSGNDCEENKNKSLSGHNNCSWKSVSDSPDIGHVEGNKRTHRVDCNIVQQVCTVVKRKCTVVQNQIYRN